MSAILVIEDSPSIALLLRRRLEMAGHSVETAASGEEALAGLSRSGAPDLILADVSMPGISGVETLRRARSLHPGRPAILVTAQQLTPEETTEADEVIAKPIDFARLLSAVRDLTASRAGSDPPSK